MPRKGCNAPQGGKGATIAFPLTISGTTRIVIPHGHAAPQEAALSGLASGLERVRASTVVREGSWVLFHVRFFRLVWNTNLLCPIDSGAINAMLDGDAIKVAYRLNIVRLCVMTTAIAFGAVVVTLAGNRDLADAAGIGLLAWLWLFGANYLVALVRFRWFVKGCVREGLAGSRMPRAERGHQSPFR